MRKKLLKFYSNPTDDPSFNKTQAKWYERLKKEGFKDQEDHSYSDRPLKRWSGVSSIYVDKFQPEGEGLRSSFPESFFSEEETFIHHPDFTSVCESFCAHGNSRLRPWKVKRIWSAYCDGKTQREMEIRFRISDTTILRVIRAITEWMNLMETRKNDLHPEETDSIVVRKFNPLTDNAMIYSTWRNSLWYDEKRDERRANEFYSRATQYIKDLIALPSTEVKIACSKKDPDFIAGYSVMSGSHLHFVYVKIKFREKGIARLLTKGTQTIEEPATKIGKKIAEKQRLEVKENHGTIQ